jgi:hypothetical protein
LGTITSIICEVVLQSVPLVQPAIADKDCSRGKTLEESYETPRKGNDLGKDASYAARTTPPVGRNGEHKVVLVLTRDYTNKVFLNVNDAV